MDLASFVSGERRVLKMWLPRHRGTSRSTQSFQKNWRSRWNFIVEHAELIVLSCGQDTAIR